MVGQGMIGPNRHRWTGIDPPRRLRFPMDGGGGSGEPIEVSATLGSEGTSARLLQSVLFPTPGRLAEAKGYRAEARGVETPGKLAAHLGE